jgi:cytochrome c peroxidase
LVDVVAGMLGEQDYKFKFRPEAVWQSMKEGVLSVMTKGITGFDAPVSGMGLLESGTILMGMSDLLHTWQGVLPQSDAVRIEKFRSMLHRAALELNAAPSSENFNQYGFLRATLSPLYAQCIETINELQMQPSGGLYAISSHALSIFDSNAMNIEFFSPNIRYLPTTERVALGRKLFFDPGFSANGRRSCATCHRPENAFADHLRKAIAIDEKTTLLRNTPTLLNAAFQTRQFYDSRMATLEFQVNNVVHNELEMGGSIERTVERLQSDSLVSSLFRLAYTDEKEPVSKFTVANALGSYMRSLTSLNARFDKAMRGHLDLSINEQNGFNLFMGKAKCGTCHFMPVFNGLLPPRYAESESEVLGVPAHRGKKAPLDADSGKFLFTRSRVHQFAFKTPTLRNIAITAPYMHNGVFNTLEQVIDFYDKGGGAGLDIPLPNLTLPADKLNLTKQEKKDLISFLQTLTDTTGFFSGRW